MPRRNRRREETRLRYRPGRNKRPRAWRRGRNSPGVAGAVDFLFGAGMALHSPHADKEDERFAA